MIYDDDDIDLHHVFPNHSKQNSHFLHLLNKDDLESVDVIDMSSSSPSSPTLTLVTAEDDGYSTMDDESSFNGHGQYWNGWKMYKRKENSLYIPSSIPIDNSKKDRYHILMK